VRAFVCPVCNNFFTPFEAGRCRNCHAALGLAHYLHITDTINTSREAT
jgi:hypothetical protein